MKKPISTAFPNMQVFKSILQNDRYAIGKFATFRSYWRLTADSNEIMESSVEWGIWYNLAVLTKYSCVKQNCDRLN